MATEHIVWCGLSTVVHILNVDRLCVVSCVVSAEEGQAQGRGDDELEHRRRARAEPSHPLQR